MTTLINSLRSLPKPISKGLSEHASQSETFKEVTGSDLFYQLTYMSAIAAAGISRSRIFLMGVGLPRTPAAYFAPGAICCRRSSAMTMPRACSMVGLAVKSEAMVSLLLRLSTALTSGQPEIDFLAEEAGFRASLMRKNMSVTCRR